MSPVDDISGGGRAYDETPYVPEDLARTLADGWHLSHITDMAGVSEPEQEKLLLIYGPVRKAKPSRTAAGHREHAQKKQSES